MRFVVYVLSTIILFNKGKNKVNQTCAFVWMGRTKTLLAQLQTETFLVVMNS